MSTARRASAQPGASASGGQANANAASRTAAEQPRRTQDAAAGQAGRYPQVDLYTEIAYLYDGSLEGLLSAVFCAYARRENPKDIARKDRFQPRIGQNVITIATDQALALRVENGITRACGPAVFNAIAVASLSDDPSIGTIVLAFVRYAMDRARKQSLSPCRNKTCYGETCSRKTRCALADSTHPPAGPLLKARRAVLNERHRMLQFIRFEHMRNGVWFARCNPNASVVPLLMGSFRARFGNEPFVIFDEVHRIAGICDGSTWSLVDERVFPLELPERADDEESMQRAWRAFYRAVSVEARYNPELRRHFMPKRFWKNLTEMHEEPRIPGLPSSHARR